MHILEQLISSDFPWAIHSDVVIDLYAPNSALPLCLIISYDQDIHIFPVLDFEGSLEKPFQWLNFERKTDPIICGLLDLIALAITKDKKSNIMTERPEFNNSQNVLIELIKNPHFPTIESGNYQIVHDDNEGDRSQTLEIESNKDTVSLRINCFDGLRFRTFFGGGKWHHTRNALYALCYVIKQNAI